MNSSWWTTLGAIVAGLAVAMGAFAAHGLDRSFHEKYLDREYEKKITVGGIETRISRIPLAEKYLADFKTGAAYQMYHGLALIAVGLLSAARPSRWLTVAGVCFVAGCLGFSGGLYAYTLTDTKWIGMFVVPSGGMLFLAGWLALALGAIPARRSPPASASPARVPPDL